jgi:hypothetical protein
VKKCTTVVGDLAWLAGAGVLAYFFPVTFVALQLVCGIATLVLRKVERAMM